MSLVVRTAVEADVVWMMKIEQASETAPHWSEQEYVRIVRPGSVPPRLVIVAELAGQVAGFAVGKVVVGVGELESVAVAGEFRQQGIGAALCRAILAWCRESGASVVELEVRASSTGVRKLYRQLGFSEAGNRCGYYEAPLDDAILMRIDLREMEPVSDV